MKTLLTLLFSLITNLCLAQTIFHHPQLGFAIEHPEDWIIAKKEELIQNIKENIKIDPNQLNKLLQESKGSVRIVDFYKYPIHSKEGIIPTIKINLRKNTTKTFDEFKKVTIESFSQVKQIFPDFKFIQAPIKTTLSGLDGLKATATYTVKAQTAEEKVTLTIYAVPVKDHFYQITFMDAEDEDNSELFDHIAKSITID